jgi:hypothetical protein
MMRKIYQRLNMRLYRLFELVMGWGRHHALTMLYVSDRGWGMIIGRS